MLKHGIFFLCLLTSFVADGQTIVRLYADNISGAKNSSVKEKTDTTTDGKVQVAGITAPTLTVYLPEKEKANGVAVIICPGGGYGFLAMSIEG